MRIVNSHIGNFHPQQSQSWLYFGHCIPIFSGSSFSTFSTIRNRLIWIYTAPYDNLKEERMNATAQGKVREDRLFNFSGSLGLRFGFYTLFLLRRVNSHRASNAYLNFNKAEGTIVNTQTNESGKPTWILSGTWGLMIPESSDCSGRARNILAR